LWSIDLFHGESINLKSHWVMVVMDQYIRKIIGIGVHAGNMDGPALWRMFNDATARQGWPKYLSSDNAILCFNIIDGRRTCVCWKLKKSSLCHMCRCHIRLWKD